MPVADEWMLMLYRVQHRESCKIIKSYPWASQIFQPCTFHGARHFSHSFLSCVNVCFLFVNKLEPQWAEPVSLSFCFEETLYRTFHRCILPNFGSFGYSVSEEKIFRNQPIRNKNCLWRLCLLPNWDEISNLNKGPSIDASYQVLVHLDRRFQRSRFLEINQSETRTACGDHVC
jgi:hypothetical protein